MIYLVINHKYAHLTHHDIIIIIITNFRLPPISHSRLPQRSSKKRK